MLVECVLRAGAVQCRGVLRSGGCVWRSVCARVLLRLCECEGTAVEGRVV